MAQSEIQVTTTPPLPGTQLVNEVNDALETIATDFSGATDPAANAFAYSLWADTNTGDLKRRNSANSAWVTIGRIYPAITELSTGKVGIGDATPSYKLTVADTGSDHQLWVRNTGTSASDDAIILVQTSGTGTTSTIAGLFFGDGDSSSVGQLRYNHNDDSFTFYTAGTVKTTISADGFVGINKTPSVPLDVSGSIHSDGVIRNTNGGSAAAPSIQPGNDADTGMYWDGTNTISFATAGTRKAQIGSDGVVLTFANSSASYGLYMTNSNASPLGIRSTYSGAAPNGTGNVFYLASDTVGTKFTVRSNGGIANYQANDANLSDRREKKDFAPCGDYLEKLCQIPVQKFRYINQAADDDGLSIGVTAQDVQAVFPELVAESDWSNGEEGSEPVMRLSIYQTDLQYVMMRAIQELKAEFDAYKAAHP